MSSPPSQDKQGAFENIYRGTYSNTLAYVLRRMESSEDANEVVAETYLVAWRRIDKLIEADEPQAWLYGVARKQLGNRRRSIRRALSLQRKARTSQPTEPSPIDPSWSAEKRAEFASVHRAMSRLPNKDQEILKLVAFEGLNHDEIAAVLGIPSSRIRSMLYRARERLNAALADDEKRRSGRTGHKPAKGGGQDSARETQS